MKEIEPKYTQFRHGRKPHQMKPLAKKCVRCFKKFADEMLKRVKGRLVCEECAEEFTL